MLLVSVGHLAGRREAWAGGWGWGRALPITKIKGFYKKCYKLVSKENPREAGGGSREEGVKRAREEGPKPSTTNA